MLSKEHIKVCDSIVNVLVAETCLVTELPFRGFGFREITEALKYIGTCVKEKRGNANVKLTFHPYHAIHRKAYFVLL